MISALSNQSSNIPIACCIKLKHHLSETLCALSSNGLRTQINLTNPSVTNRYYDLVEDARTKGFTIEIHAGEVVLARRESTDRWTDSWPKRVDGSLDENSEFLMLQAVFENANALNR